MDVIGIGLANIDLVAHVDEDFLKEHKLAKGGAQKFDALTFGRLCAALPQYDAIPGGCAANTMCGLAAIGVPAAFYGKIGADPFESLYRASFQDYMVKYDVTGGDKESSRCAVLVTPDGERSFAYTDGASWDLTGDDLDTDLLENAALICCEIYMFEFGNNSVTKKVFDIVQDRKIPLVLKVMDRDFGHRYAQKIKSLSDAGLLTLLVGNHLNLPSIVGTKTIDDTLYLLGEWKCDVLMTANRDGAYYIADGKTTHYPVTPMEHPKNTTGAGDQFLAGFLTGRLENKDVADCMDYAAACARTILMHDTARPPLVNRHSIRF